VGQLPEPRQLGEAEALFEAKPVAAARQAAAQTLERMRQDAALWGRCGPEVARWVSAR
jgi:hypothetical protein